MILWITSRPGNPRLSGSCARARRARRWSISSSAMGISTFYALDSVSVLGDHLPTNHQTNQPKPHDALRLLINWLVKKPVITVLPRSRNDGQKRVSVGSIHPSCDWAEYS
jgi:hypothetical protein